ncbi:PAS domain-containing sensor histidine kinase [filamentous cyanobacterium CCP2]|nr:PAS domain-containing sensor histidine kinase [filamentous cyanobacterium CCP2]
MVGHHLFAELVEHIPLGLMIWHLDNINDADTFRLVAANHQAQRILGFSSDLGWTKSLVPERDPFPAFLKIESPEGYAEIVRSGVSKDLGEIRYRNEQLIEKVFLAKAFPVPHQQVGVIFEDISDRKQTEEALRQLERKLLFHLQQTPLAVIEWNLDFEIVEWNPGAEKIFLYKRREVLGKPIKALIVPSLLQPEFQRVWQTLIDLKTSITSTSQNITADGRLIVCEWHSTSLVDVDSNVIGVFSIVQDITDRQQAEAALLASAIRYRQLFEASQDGVLILDADTGEITQANPFLLNLLGYSHSELLGKKLWEIGVLEQEETVQAIVQRLCEADSLRFKDLSLRTKDGQYLDVEFVSSTYSTGNQRVIQCNIRDVTHRKRSEAELRQFAKRLEQSNQELQDFASVASHDLQEPLRKIQTFGDRLQAKYADTLSDEGLDYLRRMQNAAHRMQTLINDLLTFSRITTEAKPFVQVNLTNILHDVLSDLEITIQQTSACIAITELPTIEADPTQMRQLFQNLISNAIKFHKPNIPPQIKLSSFLLFSFPSVRADANFEILADSSPHAAQCQIQFTDNGIGFDETYLDRIFTMFQRLHGRSEFEGTGMGLAICRKIVERHGGQITARSTLGQGTTFTVTLPIVQQ